MAAFEATPPETAPHETPPAVPSQPRWFYPRGALASDGWDVRIDERTPGWQHTGLRIGSAGEFTLPADGIERMVIPLEASAVSIRHNGGLGGSGSNGDIHLVGRSSVFAGPADVAYLGIETAATITANGSFAVAEAPAEERLPVAVLRAADIPIELRGAGNSTRQVHNFGTPGALAAQKLIVCEVITPAGNWSSYPPHKHDEAVEGEESRLEEIYYFESRPERSTIARAHGDPGDPFGLFAAFSSPGHPISINELVHSGDTALVPHGYHGPAVAAPGYDLYYLNVMAGPDPQRVWSITDDPKHGWVRTTWSGQTQDERLPFTGEESR
jgi:5-deoxy-glucuronate isomerase